MKRFIVLCSLIALLISDPVGIVRAWQSDTFYVAPSGSASNNGSINSPWSLAFAASGAGGAIGPGDIVNLRAGTYNNKFNFSLDGTIGNHIIFQSLPGEWAILDGYTTTTLTSGINPSTQTIPVANGALFKEADTFTFHDGEEGTEEVCQVSEVNGNNLIVNRAWAGTTAVSHSSGALLVLAGNNVELSGDYVRLKNLEITNSDPIRTQIPDNNQNAPHFRGSLNMSGLSSEVINCVLHDMQEGFGAGPTSTGGLMYGTKIYNNGFTADAGNNHNGHGVYIQNSSQTNPKVIKDCSVFNNFSLGLQCRSESGNSIGMHAVGTAAWNNGCHGGPREWNIFMAAGDGVADDLVVDTCFIYKKSNIESNSVEVNLVTTSGTAQVKNSFIGGGRDGIEMNGGDELVCTGNKVFCNYTGGQEILVRVRGFSGSAALAINSNQYFNTSGSTDLFCRGTDFRPFSEWQSAFGFDLLGSNSTSAPAENWIIVRPNEYQAGRAMVVIYNWLNQSSVTVNVSSFLSPGDSYAAFCDEEGEFPQGTPTAMGIVASGTISLPMNDSTVKKPLGFSSSPVTSQRPQFAVFEVIRTTQGGASRANITTRTNVTTRTNITTRTNVTTRTNN